MIVINLWLHGKPNWALPIEGRSKVDPFIIRDYGDTIRDHLHNIAVIVTKLQCHGWRLIESYGQLYSLEYYKIGITKDNIKEELKELKISADEISLQDINQPYKT